MTMMNRTLHFVTNRAAFNSPYFLSSPDFSPTAETQTTLQIRETLGLTRTTDDQCVRAVVAAVHGTPLVFDEFKDRFQSYRVSDFSVDAPRVIDGHFINDQGGLPEFKPTIGGAPAPDTLTLRREGADAATLTYGSFVETIPVRFMGNRTAYPAWPKDCGINGGLQFDYDWLGGQTKQIKGYPVRFPWEEAATKIADMNDAQNLLLETGLLAAFSSTRFGVEKIAIVALALAKQHPAFNE